MYAGAVILNWDCAMSGGLHGVNK